MAGYVFEHESCIHLPCGCLIARDESDHTTEDTHWQTSVHVKRCAEHESAASSGADCHQHCMSVSAAQAEFLKHVGEEAYVPVFQEGAVPEPVAGGGWKFTAEQVAQKRLKVPFQHLVSPAHGEFVVRHPHATPAIMAAMRKAVADHPKANLKIADDDTHEAVWSAHDAHPQQGVRHLSWVKNGAGVTVRPSNG